MSMTAEQKRTLYERTRNAWALTYAFVAGLNAGQGKWVGLLMVIVGAAVVMAWFEWTFAQVMKDVSSQRLTTNDQRLPLTTND